jgi:hypothetical protein
MSQIGSTGSADWRQVVTLFMIRPRPVGWRHFLARVAPLYQAAAQRFTPDPYGFADGRRCRCEQRRSALHDRAPLSFLGEASPAKCPGRVRRVRVISRPASRMINRCSGACCLESRSRRARVRFRIPDELHRPPLTTAVVDSCMDDRYASVPALQLKLLQSPFRRCSSELRTNVCHRAYGAAFGWLQHNI